MSRNIAREQHVEEGSVLFEVASLDPVWVVLEAYEEDLEWVSAGDTLRFHTRSNPARSYVATVDYIDPFVDSQTRTVSVRADLANSEDRKSTRLNSSHVAISYAGFCLQIKTLT